MVEEGVGDPDRDAPDIGALPDQVPVLEQQAALTAVGLELECTRGTLGMSQVQGLEHSGRRGHG